jgi:hypothetical protein
VPCIPIAWANGTAVYRTNVQNFAAPQFREQYEGVSVT